MCIRDSSYGKEQEGQPMALTIVNAKAGAFNSADNPHLLKSAFWGRFYVGMDNAADSKYYLYKNEGNTADATYRGNYKDFGQDVQVNYVKLYFKALASGDSITPTLDVDYGTSVTLKAIKGTANSVASYTADGAITSKKFVPPRGKQKCHAFRPVIATWAGAVSVSKIVIDFSYIND